MCRSPLTRPDAKAAAILRPCFSRVVHRCGVCGHGFIDPPYTADEMDRIYGEQYFELMAPTVGYAAGNEAASPAVRRKIERLEELIPAPAAGRRSIADIGCAHGHLLAYARERGWDVLGVEYSQDSASVARERYGFEVLVGDLENLPPLGRSLDAVTMHHVVEHLAHPDAALRRAFDWLRPGGWIVVDVPNEMDCLAFRLAHALAPARSVAYPTENPHVHYFNPAGIRDLMARCGFEVQSMRTYRISVGQGLSLVLRTALRAIYVVERMTDRAGNIEVFARRPLGKG